MGGGNKQSDLYIKVQLCTQISHYFQMGSIFFFGLSYLWSLATSFMNQCGD